ncbi:MAG: ComF family protein [Desulfovibrio sp.]|jgi:ComF family protein|nr:ComF family protein [Desulfovibrio sp.]
MACSGKNLLSRAGVFSRRYLAFLGQLAGFNQRRCRNCLSPFVPADQFDEICPDCQKSFAPYRGPVCPCCGDPSIPILCEGCANGRSWDAHAFHGLYDGHLRDMIRRFKYDGEITLAPYLAGLLLEAACCLPRADALVPLPQYLPHLSRRGFNQAHEIARHLARESGIRLEAGLLRRIRHNRVQASLDRKERMRNAAGNFEADGNAAGKSVWLVDDVMTTGSTFEAACGALKAAGCASVSILFVARTPLWHD